MTSFSTDGDPGAALEILDRFFEGVDRGRLFENPGSGGYGELRGRLWEALYLLLVWQRSWLEAARGLDWSYAALERRRAWFEGHAASDSAGAAGREARLFLALLPFRGQWRRLFEVQRGMPAHPEIRALAAREARRAAAKLAKKAQKRYKLRHFLQVLKKPELPAAKGILRIFSLPYLFMHPGLLEKLSRKYLLYLEPPWGVVFRHTWLRVFAAAAAPCLFGLGGPEDRAFLDGQEGILTTPLCHGDFLDDPPLDAAPAAPAFDLVFNASFDEMPRKRHAFLLNVLQQPELREVTALFIGRGSEANVGRAAAMIRAAGLADRVALRANLLRREVPAALHGGRLGVQVSLHENGCRSVFEYFRADLPCVATSAMAGMDPAIFNPATGRMVPDAALVGALRAALDHPGAFTPWRWFLDHSGAENASRALNATFKAIFRAQGWPWHRDIVPLGSSGASRYLDPGDYAAFKPQFAELLALFRSLPGLPIRLAED
jgi:hypothetical protein